MSFLFSGEECKHIGQLYSCHWSWQNGMCLLALCVRKHTPRLLGGNIGVVGYTLQWAPLCCQNAHCSVALPRKLFLNAFLLTCSLHHNASKCLLNVSAFVLKHFNMQYKLGCSFKAGHGMADLKSDWLSQLTVSVHLQRTGAFNVD